MLEAGSDQTVNSYRHSIFFLRNLLKKEFNKRCVAGADSGLTHECCLNQILGEHMSHRAHFNLAQWIQDISIQVWNPNFIRIDLLGNYRPFTSLLMCSVCLPGA